ncbi:MAG: CPBP family intramembrane metalloprotease [Candidatus Lokiarchaeota archaeon]|nr:CPBP family intramembrane metalloprotease [Candidatus Lokiarchaeota archaeon]
MNTTTESKELSPSSSFVKKNSLVTFFVLSYFIMIISVLIIYFGANSSVEILFFYISISSPTISAIVLAGIIGGWPEIKHLLSGFLKWNVRGFWYFAGFFLMIGPIVFTLFYTILGGEAPGNPGLTVGLIFITLINTLINGPLSEEAGWRGFALPRLESKFGSLTSSVILGIIWACWHIPLYFIEQRMPFYIFIILVLVITILMTWGYNNTNGSLIITVIFHFSFNFNGAFLTGILGLLPMMTFYMAGSVMIGIYVIVVILYAGRSKLSRKPNSEMPFNIEERIPLKFSS